MVFHYWNLLAWSSPDEPETSESETTALVTSDLVTPDSCASLRRPDLLFTCSTWLGCSGDSRPTTGPPDPVQAERIVVDVLDREWELIGFVIADALLDSIIDEIRVTLTLHSDGTLGGRGGCNGYGGSWSQPSEGGLVIDGDSYPRRVGVGAQFVGR